MKEISTLPPDAVLLGLAKIINAKLPSGAAVHFYRIQHPDNSMETGIVYQCAQRRHPVKTRARLGDSDAEKIIQSVNDWIEQIRPESKWTEDPDEEA